MKKFPSVLKFELRRNCNRRVVLLSILFIVTSLLLLQFGIDKFNNIQKDSSEFLQMELNKINRYSTINQYGAYGIRNISIPSVLFPLYYNSTPVGILQAFVDMTIRLRIYKPQMGGAVFDNSFGGNLDFSWFLLYIGSITVLAFGFFSFRDKQYIRFMLSFTSRLNLYSGIIISRAILVIGALIINLGLVLIQYYINGINPGTSISHLLISYLIALILMTFFLLLGSLIGTMNNLFKAGAVAFLCWLFFIIVLPEVFNFFISKNSESMRPINLHELNKLEILSKSEEYILKELSKYTNPTDIKNAYQGFIKDYVDNDFQKILKLEDKMIRDTMRVAKKTHFWGIFTPITFYKSVSNELSGFGYNEYKSFYNFNKEKYKRVVIFCLENSFLRTKPKEIPYLKENQYMFYAKSSLPGYFGAGVVLNLFYVLVAFGVGYFRFNRAIFQKPVKPGAYEDLDIKLEKGYHKLGYESIEDFGGQLYNVFSGRARKFTGKISIEGKSIVNKEKQDFLYIPAPHDIPAEIKVKSMVNLFAKSSELSKSDSENFKAGLGDQLLRKRFGSLEQVEKVELLVKLVKLKKCCTIIVDNPFSEISTRGKDKFFEWVFTELKGSADLVLHLERPTGALQHKYDFYSVFYPGEEKYIEQRLK